MEHVSLTHEEFVYIKNQTIGKMINIRGTIFILSGILETVAGHRIYLTNLEDTDKDCVMFYPNTEAVCMVGLTKEDVVLKDLPTEKLAEYIIDATANVVPYIFASFDMKKPFLWQFPCQMTVVNHEDQEKFSRIALTVEPLVSKFTYVMRDRRDMQGIKPGDIIEF